MSLLALSSELRYEIYAYLTPSIRTIRPFGESSLIMAISHKPPPSTLQRACCFLYHDVTAYFYSIATIQITPGHFTSSSINDNLSSLAAIRQAKTVEIVMIWYDDGWFTRPTLAYGAGNWSLYMSLEMEMIRALNRDATSLEKLAVTVRNASGNGVPWYAKEERLAQLMEVKEGVTIVVGTAVTAERADDEMRVRVVDFMKELNAIRA